MWLTNRIRQWKADIKRNCDKAEILGLTYKYRTVELLGEEKVTANIKAANINDSLVLLVRMPDWRKYLGVRREWEVDSSGCEFPIDTYYKDKNTAHDIPQQLIEEMFDELIEHKDEIKEYLEYKLKAEYFKDV